MKYSVCIPAVFNKTPACEAIRLAKSAGADAFEIWSWWDQELDALEAAQRETGLPMSAMCARIIPMNDPARREEFLEGLRETLAVAQRFGCPTLIAQVGPERAGVSRAAQHAATVEALRACAPLLEGTGVTLAIEPLNALVDHVGYYLTRSDEGFEMVREASCGGIRLLYDIYHQQITEGNLIANITGNADLIAHVHVAGVPGRHEPDEDNEIAYPAVLRALKRQGYAGYVGLEYFPRGDAVQSIRDAIARLG